MLYYSPWGNLQGIRQGQWKHLELKKNKKDTEPEETEYYLFDLANDIGEQNNLADANPEVLEKLKSRMVEVDKEITENSRPVLRVRRAKDNKGD